MATKRKANVVDTTEELRELMKKNGVKLPHGYEVVTRKKKAISAPKKKVNKGAQALKKIVAKAKNIQKHEPSISWQKAMKLAAKK